MKCPKCGENIADSAKFCTKCGCNIPEALEEKKKQEAEEIAKKKAEEEKQKIEEEKATAKAKESEIESKEKIEEPKETQPKEIEKEDKKEEKSSNKTEVKTKKKKEEKPKKTKKKHTGLKIIIILILLLIVVCATAYGLYKIDLLPDSLNDTLSPVFETVEGWFGEEKDEDDDKEKDKKKDDKEEDKESKKDEKTIKKADEDEELVYDHYNKKILGNTYKVPEINLDYKDVEKINKEIVKLVDSDLKDLEKETELPEMAPTSMDYIWTQNDNILSLVFFIHGYHVDYYYVYNVDVYTGEEIDNEDILKEAKIDEDDFDTMCSKAVEDYYENYLYYKGIEDDANIGSEYKKAKSESIKESNFDVSRTDMFLNKNGEVTIIAKLTTIAGAGTAYAPVNIENLKRNSKPLFEVKDLVDDDTTKKSETKTENKTTNEITNTNDDTTNSLNTTDTENTVN